MSVVHPLAQVGFGAGTNDLYDRARPSYQAAALSHIRDAVKSSRLNIAELGAGTGIFTRALLAHPEWSTCIDKIRAVEPSQGMREVFADTVKDERVTVVEGSFEDTSVNDGWADIVVIAQAFHWCPDYGRAVSEFARILKPGGVLALIWNLEDRERARWVAQLRDRVERHENGTPQFRLNLWRQAFETASYQTSFQAPREIVWSFALPATLEIAVDRALSKSYTAILPQDERAKFGEDIKAIVEKGEDKVWLDESQGVFEYPYRCFVVIADRKD